MSLVEQTRQDALALFKKVGLPSKRDEDWKYTDASRLADLLEIDEPNTAINAEGLGIADLDAYRMVFINGIFDEAQSNLPDGVSIVSLAVLQASVSNEASEALAKLFRVSGDEPLFNGLMALNAATASDGAAVCLADNSVLDKPLYILHVSNQNNVIRHGLMLGENAQAQVIEHFISTGEERALSNCVTAVILKNGASLEHSRLQQEGEKQSHVARVEVKQCRDSLYTFHGIELGASLSRTDLVVSLSEPGAACELNGLFVLGGRQHVDHHTRVDHEAPHCTSRENYRTVLDGRSHGVFNGKVVVHEGAVKTDSAQSNGNLLLSRHAEIDTKPELEIYNDDVKCAHGATVGQLDDKQLFYLCSRGISQEAAQELLTFAFAGEILAAMSNQTVRSYVEKAAFAKLPHGADLDGLIG
ncbi:MAG: Fe-S cluster assembly protein SufD [Mariprofundaceae bacterium]|nr:Fe-S cluster assembly protein SufD [Mariprofundaceae bacterium]